MFLNLLVRALLLGIVLCWSCQKEKMTAEDEYVRVLRLTGELDYFYVPDCEGDLWAPLQHDQENMRWCVDVISGEVISAKSEQLTSCNGCLAEHLKTMLGLETAEAAGANVNNVYFIDCQDEDPEYYDMKQCWVGYFNACWCVDETTGQATSMPTQNEISCERAEEYVGWCNVLQGLVSSYFHAYYNVREIGPTGNLRPDLQFEMQCGYDGNFAKEQCLGGICWCVDPVTGILSDPGSTECSIRSKSSTWNVCQKNKAFQFEAYYYFVLRGVMLEHFTIPHCTGDGDWDYIQCSNQTIAGHSECWCVNRITGVPTTGASVDLTSCTSCLSARMRRLVEDTEDTTTCDETGEYYTVLQCNYFYECWCVDRVTGQVLFQGDAVTGEEMECEQLVNTDWD